MSQTRTRKRSAQRAPQPPPKMISPIVWYAVGGVAVALLLVGIVISMDPGSTDSDGLQQLASSQITGNELPLFDSALGVDPAAGSPIPEVSGSSFDGAGVSISHGTPQAIVFLAH